MRLSLLAWVAAAGLAISASSTAKPDTVVVVMAYNRIDSLHATLETLLVQGGAKWPLVVPQSVHRGNDTTVDAASGAIQRVANRVVRHDAGSSAEVSMAAAGRAVEACLTAQGGDGQSWSCAVHAPTFAADDSLGRGGGRMHGSKLESSRNLLHGLALAASLSWARFVVVVEDDALLSDDAVSSLTFMHREVMGAEWTPWGSGRPERVRLGTTQALLRPGLFSDMGDWADLSTAAAVSAAEAQLEAAGQGASQSAVASRIDVRRATGRTVIRTFAWTVDATLAAQLRDLLAEQTAQARPAAEGDATGSVRPRSEAGTGLGHLVEWCSWCSPLCYDHAVEALVAGSLVAVTAVPRSASPVNVGLSGAVSGSDSTRRQYRGRFVAASQWQASFDEGDPAQRVSKAEGGWWGATALSPQARPNVMPSNSAYFRALASGPRSHAHVPLESVHFALPFALRDPTVTAVLAGVFGILLGGLLLA